MFIVYQRAGLQIEGRATQRLVNKTTAMVGEIVSKVAFAYEFDFIGTPQARKDLDPSRHPSTEDRM